MIPAHQHNHSNRKGFAHLVLLLLVFLAVAGGIFYLILFKRNSLNFATRTSPNTTVTPSATPQSLEDQANAIPEENPEEGFEEIDKDISNL